jgi:hypothetical protein
MLDPETDELESDEGEVSPNSWYSHADDDVCEEFSFSPQEGDMGHMAPHTPDADDDDAWSEDPGPEQHLHHQLGDREEECDDTESLSDALAVEEDHPEEDTVSLPSEGEESQASTFRYHADVDDNEERPAFRMFDDETQSEFSPDWSNFARWANQDPGWANQDPMGNDEHDTPELPGFYKVSSDEDSSEELEVESDASTEPEYIDGSDAADVGTESSSCRDEDIADEDYPQSEQADSRQIGQPDYGSDDSESEDDDEVSEFYNPRLNHSDIPSADEDSDDACRYDGYNEVATNIYEAHRVHTHSGDWEENLSTWGRAYCYRDRSNCWLEGNF